MRSLRFDAVMYREGPSAPAWAVMRMAEVSARLPGVVMVQAGRLTALDLVLSKYRRGWVVLRRTCPAIAAWDILWQGDELETGIVEFEQRLRRAGGR